MVASEAALGLFGDLRRREHLGSIGQAPLGVGTLAPRVAKDLGGRLHSTMCVRYLSEHHVEQLLLLCFAPRRL